MGAQAVDPGMGEQGSGDRVALPADRRGERAGSIRNDLNGVVLAHPMALGLQAPDAFPELVDLLGGAWPRQALVQGLQDGFKALGEALGDPLFLAGPAFGETEQPHLFALGVDHPLDGQRLTTGRGQRRSGGGIELALALAADHQVAIALGAQPEDVLCGRDPGVHHHQGATPRPQAP
jgi:hypothetical protein